MSAEEGNSDMRAKLGALLLTLAALIAVPALAAAQPRDLAVPAGASWKHAASDMVLPPTVDGLTRSELRDTGASELDVAAQYANREERLWVTVYLFRPGVEDLPLWFDRALTALLTRPEYGLTGVAAPIPAAFARPGATNASGLRASIDVGREGVTSTGVAMAQVGPFFLKIRISSGRLDRAGLDERLTRFIEGLRWPAERTPAARTAVAMEPCPTPLRLRNARLLRSEDADLLAGALMGVELTDEDGNAPPPPVYCREPGASPAFGVYRPNASRDSYVIALNDAGIAYSVAQSIDLGALTGQGSSGRRFALTLRDRDAIGVVASFNRPPPPEQALDVVRRLGGPTILISQSPRAGN
jgi:opacity protein-like surface antigen